jgi:leucyl aminopeptidase
MKPTVSYITDRPADGIRWVGVFPSGKLTTSFYDSETFKSYSQMASVGECIYDASLNILIYFLPEMRSPLDCQRLGGCIFKKISHKENKIFFLMDQMDQECVRNISYGFRLRSWRFETHHTSFRPLPSIKCSEVAFVTPYAPALTKCMPEENAVIDSVHWARQLANQPGNIMYPESMKNHLQSLQSLGIEVDVLDPQELSRQGFGALLGVGQGSIQPPYLVSLIWKGLPEQNLQQNPPIVFVGKGVTFDSGGLSLKNASGMMDMKLDKTGAVVVSAVLRALALRKAKINAVAVVALAENMPSGSAQRPGDIVTSLSGQTIEVLNTDAEGRLILADALTYAQKTYKPKVMVDVATLTGAVRIALGSVYAGLFSNFSKLSQELIAAGENVGELLWPLPLHKEYDKSLNSDNADMQNISTQQDGSAGASMGAHFLQRFVPDSVQWAHLDIASVDHLKKDTPLCPKGGSAFGVRLLDQWIRSYEKN